MPKLKLKVGDVVKIITGNHKGKTGAIKTIDIKKDRVKVEGVALCTRHYKARTKEEQSQKKIIERFIAKSNVELVNKA